ncbi:MAG: hypothetical protein K2M85_06565 [Paramuribaculum sp.]|nr:hypothetical protein [Paramuribaculum sp.]
MKNEKWEMGNGKWEMTVVFFLLARIERAAGIVEGGFVCRLRFAHRQLAYLTASRTPFSGSSPRSMREWLRKVSDLLNAGMGEGIWSYIL